MKALMKMYGFIFGPVMLLLGSLIFLATFPTPHPVSIALLGLGTASIGYLIFSLWTQGYKVSEETITKLYRYRNTKRVVVVVVQNSNTRLLGEIYYGIVEVKLAIERNLRLKEVSILRGDLNFCREVILQKREYASIVVLDESLYNDKKVTRYLLENGSAVVYKGTSTTPEELVKSIERSILHFFTGNFR